MLRPIPTTVIALAATLSACSPADTDPAVGDETEAPIPVDPLSEEALEQETQSPATTLLSGEPASGNWFFNGEVIDEIGPRAIYGEAMEDARFAVSCDGRAGQVVLSRAGAISPGREVEMRIVTSAGEESLVGRSGIGDLPMIEARLAPDNGFLDRLAATSDAFAVSVETTETLLMRGPGNQIARVVDACREQS